MMFLYRPTNKFGVNKNCSQKHKLINRPIVQRCALILLLTGGLLACSGLQPTVYSKGGSATAEIERQIDYWLQEAERSSEPAASRARVKASLLMLRSQQTGRAQRELSLINTGALSGSDAVNYSLATAMLAKANGRPAEVLARLEPEQLGNQVNTAQRAEAGMLRAWALQKQGQALLSARQRDQVDPLLSDAVLKEENRTNLWLSLTGLSAAALDKAAAVESTETLRGWLTLAALHKRYGSDARAQQAALQQWRGEWRSHPAANDLPIELQSSTPTQTLDTPQRITLMLPASGKLAAAGAAVRDGFMAAYYSADTADNSTLQFVDTSAYPNFRDAYSAALQTAPDMIVGPLRKSELAALQPLLQANSPPVLALNYMELDHSAGMFQFGLAVEDEARQIADTLMQQGSERALIIRPTGARGQRAAKAFKQPWVDAGGIVLDEVSYTSQDNLSGLLREALQVDRSDQRKNRIESLLGSKVEFVPRRRKDIDFFFLFAKPEQARSLKPILAFHYAGDVPVYATSRVFTGTVQAHRDRDLNGIIFTETPWLLDSNSRLRNQLDNLTPAKSSYVRMQAFGADAYALCMQLGTMLQNPGSQIEGQTGKLSLGPGGRVVRQLDMAQFVRGEPRRLPPPKSAPQSKPF